MDLEPMSNGMEPSDGVSAEAGVTAVLNEPAPHTPGIDLIKDIELQVTLRFGSAQMSLKDLSGLNTGSVIQLDRALTDPVDVMIGGFVIARGEPIVVRGVYGIRISEIASHHDRMTSSLRMAASERSDA
jgi:flagellar motor switch protein FliN/FliY